MSSGSTGRHPLFEASSARRISDVPGRHLASDAGAIEDLVNPSYDASADIRSRIEGLGGQALHYETLQFHGVGMQDLTSVDLTLRSGKAGTTTTFTDSLPLARSKGRWYLVIGHHR
jgi:hypothetical protein